VNVLLLNEYEENSLAYSCEKCEEKKLKTIEYNNIKMCSD